MPYVQVDEHFTCQSWDQSRTEQDQTPLPENKNIKIIIYNFVIISV